MIPYSFTVTSHIVITLGLATMAFVSINIIGIKTHGIHLLSLFLPPGAPLALAPLLVMIELVSYSFRVVSLALRLFANMMSGHCLLKILGVRLNNVSRGRCIDNNASFTVNCYLRNCRIRVINSIFTSLCLYSSFMYLLK